MIGLKKPVLQDDEPVRMPKAQTQLLAGFFVILVGIIILTIATVLCGGDSIGVGSIIIFGPIPLVIGTRPDARWMILFAVILTATTIIMFLIYRKEPKTSEGQVSLSSFPKYA
jgi:uncharacterized membrane protein